MIKTCEGCGAQYEAKTRRSVRCRKNCGRTSASKNRSRTDTRTDVRDSPPTFIGVDGEGVTRPDGEHIYDVLSCGDRTLSHVDGSHLHYEDILSFLYDCFLEDVSGGVSRPTYVGFFLGYDWAQWVRTMDEHTGHMLYSKAGIESRQRKDGHSPVPFPVRTDNWEMDVLPGKRFKFRPRHDDPFSPAKPAKWMHICDVGSFFQSSFLAVLEPKKWPLGHVCTDEELRIITEGKANRGGRYTLEQQLSERTDTQRYNILENDILARVMRELDRGFRVAGVHLQPQQYFGPGQAAQQWLSNNGAPTAEEIQAWVPLEVRQAARLSYYGAIFELEAHGHVPGTTYEYDLNSAYPFEITKLPCLCPQNEWIHEKYARGRNGLPMNIAQYEYVLIDASVRAPEDSPRFGPVQHRMSNGFIRRPGGSRGWHWKRELSAATKANLVGKMTVHEYWAMKPCGHAPPLAKVKELYEQRLQVKKESSAGKALKLLYNSMYGKFAQSVGNPKFANSLYASLITMGCRASIIEAIATHPNGVEDLLMIATDGVYFSSPHPNIDIDPERLGAWDVKKKENLTLFMPGVYWDDVSRERVKSGNAPDLKSRGISAHDLARKIADIDLAFDRLSIDWMKHDTPWPSLTMPVAFVMVTPGQALNRRKWHLCGAIEDEQTPDAPVRRINSDPYLKRLWQESDRDAGYWRSRAHPEGMGDEFASTSYERLFGDEQLDSITEAMTPDGPFGLMMANVLGMK